MPVIEATEFGLLHQATGLEGDGADELRKAAERAEKFLAETRDEVSKIQADHGLTPEGRRERLRELAEERREAFDRATAAAHVEKLAEQVEVTRKGLLSRALTPKEELSEAREVEIRSLVRRELEKPAGDILVSTMVRSAAREDDRAFLLAVERAPRGFELVPAETMAEARELQMAAAFPEEYDGLRSRNTLASALEFNRRLAAETLAKVSRGAVDYRPERLDALSDPWPDVPEDEAEDED